MRDKGTEIPDTYTLRLPSQLRKRVERLAQSNEVSLNQQIVRILEEYFMEAGDQTGLVKTPAGRVLQISCDRATGQTEWVVAVFVSLTETRIAKTVATITFGIAQGVLEDLKVAKKDYDSVTEEIGKALIQYLLGQGIEPEALCWTQYASSDTPQKRFLKADDISDGIRTPEDFLAALTRGDWFDKHFAGNYIHTLNRKVCDVDNFATAAQVAEEVLTCTTEAHHVVGSGPALQPLELSLLTAIILITARKCGTGRSQLLFMRSLVNSPKTAVFKELSDEERHELSSLLDASDGVKTTAFASVNQRLLRLAPQQVFPVFAARS